MPVTPTAGHDASTPPRPSAADPAPAPEPGAGAGPLTAGALYQECLAARSDQWFTLRDCAYRYFLTVLMLYWSLLTTPAAFTRYLYRYCVLWYGTIPGLMLFMTLPVLPLGIAALVTVKRVKSLFVTDWQMAGPGKVFFLKPANPAAAFLWDLYLTQSMLVGQFNLVGNHPTAMSHTWEDTILNKDFWRAALSRVGARLPRELARWKQDRVEWRQQSIGKTDVVVKIPDSYLGVGDSFWTHGKDFSDEAGLAALLGQEYKGKEAMVLELCRPSPTLGVHSLDILTLRDGAGEVKVLSVLIWTDCTTSSSHSCRAGYCIDVETERVTGPASWYSPFFAQMEPRMVGQVLPGVRKACETAVAAHAGIQEKWLTAVGWDGMIMGDGEVVFFEGNFAGARTPRRVFLSFSCLCAFVRQWAWPFGRSMRPPDPAG